MEFIRKENQDLINKDTFYADPSLIGKIPLISQNYRYILVVDCEEDRDLKQIARNLPASLCVGMDEEIRDTPDDLLNIKFVKSSLPLIPFPDDSFDLVVANGVLYRLSTQDAITLINEMKRVGSDVWYTELGTDLNYYTVCATQDAFSKFAILGSFRTGTTLLKTLLNQHPDLRCLSETESEKALTYTDDLFIDTAYLGIQLPEITSSINMYPLWKDAKFIFTHRNPVDIVASFKLYIQKQNYFDPNDRFDLEQWCVNYATAHCESELNTYQNKSLAAMAIYIREIQNLSKIYPCLVVEYDELVNNPTDSLTKIFTYLGVSNKAIDTSFVFSTSVDKGKIELTAEEILLIEEINGITRP